MGAVTAIVVPVWTAVEQAMQKARTEAAQEAARRQSEVTNMIGSIRGELTAFRERCAAPGEDTLGTVKDLRSRMDRRELEADDAQAVVAALSLLCYRSDPLARDPACRQATAPAAATAANPSPCSPWPAAAPN